MVEDHLPDVMTFRESLARRGIAFTLEHYSDGEAAANAFAAMTAAPDLVVLDLQVPRIDGFDLLERIRGNAVTARTPVLVLTSSNAERDRVRAQQNGADSYLVKPSGFVEFMNAVASGIQRLLADRPGPQVRSTAAQGGGKDCSADGPQGCKG